MTCTSRNFQLLAILAIALGSLTLDASIVRADDPPPIDPTLGSIGSVTGLAPTAQVVDADAWAVIEETILGIFPDADYATICYYAEVWFYALPPDYTP